MASLSAVKNLSRLCRTQNILAQQTHLLSSSASFLLKRKAKLAHQPQPINPLVVGPFLREQLYKEPRPVGDFIFEEVEQKPEVDPKLKVLLLKTVDELGVAGDIVEVDRDYARNELLSSQAATYYNEFNHRKYREIIESGSKDRSGPSSAFVNATIKKLAREVIVVVMNDRTPWTIDKRHIKIAFRSAGYSVNESCIELPESPITGPNVEEYQGKDFAVTLTINNKEKVRVRCMLHHRGLPMRLDWDTEPRFPLLEEQKDVLATMPVKEAKKDEDLL